MRFGVLLVLAFIAVTAVSFLSFSRLFGVNGVREQKAFTAAHVAHYTNQLSHCMKSESARSERASRIACLPIAVDLFAATQQPPREGYYFHKKAVFEVLQTGRHLVAFRRACTDGDLATKTFAWNAVPVDLAVLPSDRRVYGSFSGSVEFPDAGLRLERGCIVLIELPVDRLKSFYIGQWNRSTGKWLWQVEGNVF